jgi:hypothetical protein
LKICFGVAFARSSSTRPITHPWHYLAYTLCGIIYIIRLHLFSNCINNSKSCVARLRPPKCPECNRNFRSADECKKNFELIRQMRMIQGAIQQSVQSFDMDQSCQLPPPPRPSTFRQSGVSNVAVCEICGENAATLFCESCPVTKNTLCDDCSQLTHKAATRAGHVLAPWTPDLAVLMCAAHPDQRCALYCKGCIMPCCTVCSHGGHKNHDLSPIEEVEGACTSRMQAALTKLDVIAAAVQTSAQKIDDVHKAVTGRSITDVAKTPSAAAPRGTVATKSAEIRQYFDKLRSDVVTSINTRESQVLEELRVAAESTTTSLCSEYDTESVLVSRAYFLRYHIRDLQNKHSPLLLLQSEAKINADVDALEHAASSLPVLTPGADEIATVAFPQQQSGLTQLLQGVTCTTHAPFAARAPTSRSRQTPPARQTQPANQSGAHHTGPYVSITLSPQPCTFHYSLIACYLFCMPFQTQCRVCWLVCLRDVIDIVDIAVERFGSNDFVSGVFGMQRVSSMTPILLS